MLGTVLLEEASDTEDLRIRSVYRVGTAAIRSELVEQRRQAAAGKGKRRKKKEKINESDSNGRQRVSSGCYRGILLGTMLVRSSSSADLMIISLAPYVDAQV